jgi:hypothetical protein
MKNRCSKCGAKAESNLCWLHKPKKSLARSQIKSKNFVTPKTETVEQSEMLLFFQQLWKKRKHYSEVSGEFLGNQFSTIYQHHILGKKKYPQACFDEENIIFLSAQEHSSVELNMYKYQEVNKRREYLKTKYNIL